MDSARNNTYERRGGAGGRGRGRAGDGGRWNSQGGRERDTSQNQPGRGRGRGWDTPHRGSNYQQPQWVNRSPAQPAPPNAWGHRPQQTHQVSVPPPAQPNQAAPPNAWGYKPQQTRQVAVPPASGRAGVSPPSAPSVQCHTPPQASVDEVDIPSLKISDREPVSSLDGKETQIETIRRPDRGGTLSVRPPIRLLVNHFLVDFDKEKTIFHYNVDVKLIERKLTRKSDMRFIKDKVFSDDHLLNIAYDGDKNIFSAIRLETGQFTVDISEGEEVRRGEYKFTVEFQKQLKLSELGNLSSVSRNILQCMDLVMKENPIRKRILVGRNFFSPRGEHDLGGGLAAYKGFQHSLKQTSQGPSLCLDYSVVAFRRPLPVIEFLKENVRGFRGVNDVKRLRNEIDSGLTGLKVSVTHRRTKQKYTIAGLTPKDTRDIDFDLVDPDGNTPPRRVMLVDYFKDKWGEDIMHQNIPCLELGTAKKSNQVPMEFCQLVEGQRYPKEDLDKNAAKFLKNLTLARPQDRRNTICEMVRSEDGPYGDVARSFGIRLDENMTKVMARIISPPQLKLGASRPVNVDVAKCQWNLVGKSFVYGKPVDRWALLDFTDGDHYANVLIDNLIGRCRNLGIQMAKPLVHHITRMSELSHLNRLENLFVSVVDSCKEKNQGKLQLIVCLMTEKHPGYKGLKWVSETRIGVVTQCCLPFLEKKGQDQCFANLCLKINAKLGGNNFELMGRPLPFPVEDHVMFIGADVNHPGAMNKSSPSIAAVVASVNWPAANKYAARVSPQEHRCEEILNFGSMCSELVRAYARLNGVKPRRIVVFRDGVSDGQFKMVLKKELLDLKNSICTNDYQPMITVVVAKKRHLTRLFVHDQKDGGANGNIPPGTVVDTVVVDPHDFDFYLCSHYGSLGTSKPTHYYVPWDENAFTSDQLQKLIFDMCFTFVRCTKPVSLVPPVYYADLVAYRGRMYQEFLNSASSSSASSPSTSSFDQRLYSLHSDLEDDMFFI